MSPIGRVFAVLNVGFAFAFLYHAGVYHQRDAHWKTEYQQLEQSTTERIDSLEQRNQSLADEVSDKDRQLNASEVQKSNLEEENTRLQKEVERLENTLQSMQGDVARLSSAYEQIDSTLRETTRAAEQARQASIQANMEKDDAEAAQLRAEADLRRAQDRIASMQEQIDERESRIANLESTVREQDIELEVVRLRAPGLLLNAKTPRLAGTVQRIDADGRLLTIVVSENPSDAEIAPGYTFAIYNDEGVYKGEATIQDVDGNFAFCRLTTPNPGTSIEVGDRASTQTR